MVVVVVSSRNLSSNLDSFKDVAYRREGIAYRREGVAYRREGVAYRREGVAYRRGGVAYRRGGVRHYGCRFAGNGSVCDRQDRQRHRLDEHDVVPQNSLLHDVPVLPTDIAGVFQIA